MKKHFSTEEKKIIIDIAKKNGISKTAKLYNLDRQTIREWIRKDRENQLERKVQLNRKCVDAKVKERVINLWLENPSFTLKELKEYSKSSIGLTSIHRIIAEQKERNQLIFKSKFYQDFSIFFIENISNSKFPYLVIVKDNYSNLLLTLYTKDKSDLILLNIIDYLLSLNELNEKIVIRCNHKVSYPHWDERFNEISSKYCVEIAIKLYKRVPALKNVFKKRDKLFDQLFHKVITSIKVDEIIGFSYILICYYNLYLIRSSDLESNEIDVLKKIIFSLKPSLISKSNNSKPQSELLNDNVILKSLEDFKGKMDPFLNSNRIYSKILDLFNGLLSSIDQSKNLDLTIKIYYNISDLLLLKNRLTEVESYHQQAYELVKRENHKRYLISILQRQSKVAHLQKSYKKNLNLLKRCNQLILDYGTIDQYLKSILDLSIVYFNIGKHNLSKKYLIKGLTVSKRNNNIFFEISFCSTLSVNYARLRQQKKSELLLNHAYKRVQSFDRIDTVSIEDLERLKHTVNFNYFAKELKNSGNIEGAIEYFKYSLDKALNANSSIYIVNSLVNLSSCYLKKGEFNDALLYSYKVEKYCDKNDFATLAVVNNFKARSFYSLNKIKDAIDYCQNAIKCGIKSQKNFYLIEVYTFLSKLGFMSNDYKMAYDGIKKSIKIINRNRLKTYNCNFHYYRFYKFLQSPRYDDITKEINYFKKLRTKFKGCNKIGKLIELLSIEEIIYYLQKIDQNCNKNRLHKIVKSIIDTLEKIVTLRREYDDKIKLNEYRKILISNS